jgi:hypothetical protein
MAQDFMFSMKFAGGNAVEPVLDEVAVTVFRQAGCEPDAAARLVKELHAAVVEGGTPAAADVDVQFRAHAGSCDVVVFAREREIWRASCPVP